MTRDCHNDWYSIDTFLETRATFLDVGKGAIADVLLRAEANAKAADVDSKVDWYRYLLNTILLRRNIAHFQAQVKLLRIVTFNFDRSLEYALFNGVCNSFGMGKDEASELVKEVRVHHVHGRLGKPAWLYPDSPRATLYGATGGELQEATRRAVEGMRVVHEHGRDPALEKAREALEEASTVYFIGFGFDERNLAKLDIPRSLGIDIIPRCTLFGWSTAEQAPLSRYFQNRHMHLYPKDDAIRFLREHAFEIFD